MEHQNKKKAQTAWVNKESDCENGHISVEDHQKIERYYAYFGNMYVRF